jgi:signal transduction histidine kinase
VVIELRPLRQRGLMDAADAARHRIQRDLHDGAQQRFLSVTISLQLAELALESDPDAAHALLREAVCDLEIGLSELDDLTCGLLPAAVRRDGLIAALHRLVSEAPVDAALDVHVDGPVDEDAERAVFFVVSETLGNVQRHAPGARARVSLCDDPRGLRIVVADDGPGGADPNAGSGLRGLAERLAALGGDLRVKSRLGHGTSIVANVPREYGVARHTTVRFRRR